MRSSLLAALPLVCLAVLLIVSSVHAHDDHDHSHDDSSTELNEDYTRVTYGSAIKLVHKSSKHRLHSHQIQWGSGSGQQSVTGFEHGDDPNSLWQIKHAHAAQEQDMIVYPPGTIVKCGDILRLQHASTKKYLHSHLHAAPLSHRQEISGYGDDTGRLSDSGDNWKVDCPNNAKEWLRDVAISLQHVDTGKRLYTTKRDMFDQNNCRGCPIVGQTEISAHTTGIQDPNALWTAEDGIYFPVISNE